MSRSRSRMSMDWRGNSVSRSRSRAPNSRFDFDTLDHNERHSHALLANLEEVQEYPTTIAPSSLAHPSNSGLPGAMFIPQDHQTSSGAVVTNAAAASVTTAAGVPMPASSGSSAQSLLSLKLQGLQGAPTPITSPTTVDPSRLDDKSAVNFSPFRPPPNPFQNGSSGDHTGMYLAASLPAFGPSTDAFGPNSFHLANNAAFAPHRVVSQDHVGGAPPTGGAFKRIVRKTSFDHTVARVGSGNESRPPPSSSSNARKVFPLSPVSSSTSLVRAFYILFVPRLVSFYHFFRANGAPEQLLQTNPFDQILLWLGAPLRLYELLGPLSPSYDPRCHLASPLMTPTR